MKKWLLKKFVPYETLVEAAFDKGVEKANDAMAREGTAAVVSKVANAGQQIARHAEEVCRILADGKIDETEKAAVKKNFVPFVTNAITKALDA